LAAHRDGGGLPRVDAFAKSKGAIDFPSRYAEGYAYIKSKVYGDRPARSTATKTCGCGCRAGSVTIDSPQINHVDGHGNGKLYLA
jgi:hypothetical protein